MAKAKDILDALPDRYREYVYDIRGVGTRMDVTIYPIVKDKEGDIDPYIDFDPKKDMYKRGWTISVEGMTLKQVISQIMDKLDHENNLTSKEEYLVYLEKKSSLKPESGMEIEYV